MLAVMDVIPEEQPTPRWVALYELGLLLRTAATGSTRWRPASAGSRTPASSRPLDQAQAVLLVARKPADG
jgi:hypothetical protein